MVVIYPLLIVMMDITIRIITIMIVLYGVMELGMLDVSSIVWNVVKITMLTIIMVGREHSMNFILTNRRHNLSSM